MTTKKARARRLIPSENYTRTGASGDLNWWWTQSNLLTVDVSRSIHRNPRHRWWCGRVQWEAVLYHPDNIPRQIYAETRLALHDAILRAGWPSPWREVKATVGTIVTDHVEPMKRFVRRAEELKSGGHCTPSATSPKLIAQSDMPAGTVVNRHGARAVAGEIPFGVAPVALRKGEAFVPKRNNVEEL